MALTLNAEQKSIYNIFSGENQYVIPPYQRAYSWTNTQCKELFEDIKKAFYETSQEGYFLGNIVLAKSREEKNRLEVIDGQQRLTSLTLLLKVLLSFDKENKALYNAIWIKDRRTDEEMQRVETNVFMEKDFNYFKEVLGFDFSKDICASMSKEDNLFKKNICYFYKELKEFSKNNDVFKFSDFLLDNVYILPIETEDNNADKARKNALQVFETINNRGLNLSISDILKAQLYSMALNELEHEKFIEKWKKLAILCDEINYSINDIFDIYGHIIQNKKDMKDKINLYELFINNKYSPFVTKKYDEVFYDLFEIVDFIQAFNERIQNANKYGESSKWFQLLNQAFLSSFIPKSIFFIRISKLNFINNKEDLIGICKDIIRENIPLHDKEGEQEVWGFSGNDSFYILLGIYLDRKNKAIYPYYFLNKRIDIPTLVDLGLIQDDNRQYIADLINKSFYFLSDDSIYSLLYKDNNNEN